MLQTVHLIIAISTALIVLYADEQALLWLLGKNQTMKKSRVTFLHNAVTLGLALLILTGGFMYYDIALIYLAMPLFVSKMVIVFALILNTYAIDKFSALAITRPFDTLSHAERVPLFISGGLSFLGWIAVISCGLLIS